MSSIADVRLMELPRVEDPRGSLTFIEGKHHVPFEIKRVFYLYDVPGGETHAGHANRDLEEFFIAASGSFDVIVDDGSEHQRYQLNRSYFGVYVPGMIWRELVNFSSGSVCLVLASDYYDENDYYRTYDEYKLATETK